MFRLDKKTAMRPMLLILSLLVLCSTGCSTPEENPEEQAQNLEAETRLDVSYGDNPQEAYDIYLPEGRTANKTKVILLVHGGGWVEGDKADMNGFIDLVQELHPEHAIVNMNYVLANFTTPAFPNQFLDIDAVINKLTAEKDELQILPEFGLIGVSAGAHLSLQYDYVYDTDDQVKFVVDIVGPTDFTDPYFADDPQFQLALDLFVDEDAYEAGIDLAAATSPAQQVSAISSPTLMFYGNQDPLVPLTNGDRLNTALNSVGVTHTFNVYNAGHGDFNAVDAIDVRAQINAFIDAHLAIDN